MRARTLRPLTQLLWVSSLAFVVGCSHEVIPNTDVADTPENREVVDFVEDYREAVAARDVERLISLASVNYYDDMGTPAGDDDVDFDSLSARLQNAFGEKLTSVHYDIRYREVIFLPTKVLVDFTYIGRFQVETPDGPRWERRLSDNRMILAREDSEYRIVSGM